MPSAVLVNSYLDVVFGNLHQKIIFISLSICCGPEDFSEVFQHYLLLRHFLLVSPFSNGFRVSKAQGYQVLITLMVKTDLDLVCLSFRVVLVGKRFLMQKLLFYRFSIVVNVVNSVAPCCKVEGFAPYLFHQEHSLLALISFYVAVVQAVICGGILATFHSIVELDDRLAINPLIVPLGVRLHVFVLDFPCSSVWLHSAIMIAVRIFMSLVSPLLHLLNLSIKRNKVFV